jgi:glutathione reductase (NADPH)
VADSYDLIVVGAGMAGAAAANKCSLAGWRVAIVDELPYGGTCALRGCDPKKILRRGGEIVDSARLMSGKGINVDGLSINWADLIKHKRGFTDPVPRNMEAELARNGVETLHGTATFETESRLLVDGRRYQSSKFLIAAGAHPRPVGFPGAEHLIDSTDFLSLEELPRRVIFVGGGFVSFEFAHIAARAGASPVIVDRGVRPLKRFDPDLVDLLVARGADVGIDMRTQATINSVQRVGPSYRVTLGTTRDQAVIEADLVVHGAGRVPQLSRLHLDAAGVAYSTEGVTVAGHLQSTTNPAVYAAGDAADTPGLPLTPVAVFEGKVAASNMLNGTTTTPDYTGVPTAVFHHPRTGAARSSRRRSQIEGHRCGRPLQRHERLVFQLPPRGDSCGHKNPCRQQHRHHHRRPHARPWLWRADQLCGVGYEAWADNWPAQVDDHHLPQRRIRPQLHALSRAQRQTRSLPAAMTSAVLGGGGSATAWRATRVGS